MCEKKTERRAGEWGNLYVDITCRFLVQVGPFKWLNSKTLINNSISPSHIMMQLCNSMMLQMLTNNAIERTSLRSIIILNIVQCVKIYDRIFQAVAVHQLYMCAEPYSLLIIPRSTEGYELSVLTGVSLNFF